MPTALDWSPGTVPYGADETIYLVVDSFDVASPFRRAANIERTDLEILISDLLSGQFTAPARVVAFNTLEHWSTDVSRDIAFEIQSRCDMEGVKIPEHISDFVELNIGATRRPIRRAALAERKGSI
jgi:hypothetical protein